MDNGRADQYDISHFNVIRPAAADDPVGSLPGPYDLNVRMPVRGKISMHAVDEHPEAGVDLVLYFFFGTWSQHQLTFHFADGLPSAKVRLKPGRCEQAAISAKDHRNQKLLKSMLIFAGGAALICPVMGIIT